MPARTARTSARYDTISAGGSREGRVAIHGLPRLATAWRCGDSKASALGPDVRLLGRPMAELTRTHRAHTLTTERRLIVPICPGALRAGT